MRAQLSIPVWLIVLLAIAHDTSALEPRLLPDIPSTREPPTATPDEASKSGYPREILVEGRFGYIRDDGEFVGANNTWIGFRDEDDYPFLNDQLGGTRTDENGFFQYQFTWDGGNFPEESNPDLTVWYAPSNGFFGFYDTAGEAIDFGELQFSDFGGTYLDLGTRIPALPSDYSAVHVQSVMSLGARLLDELGVWGGTPDYSPVVWNSNEPETGCCTPTPLLNGVYSAIHIRPEDVWRDDVLLGLVADNYLDKHAALHPRDYCNGICDTGGCSSCDWCPENVFVAVQDGLKLWFHAHVARRWNPSLEWDVRYSPSVEWLGDCAVAPEDPTTTAGHFAALLHDLEDAQNGEDHPQFPGPRDVMDMSPANTFIVIDNDGLADPYSFLFDLRNDLPGLKSEIWETAANCGYDMDLFKPGAVTGLYSPSHPIGVPLGDATVDMEWTPPSDDASGVVSYSWSFTASAQMPDQTVEPSEPDRLTSSPLGSGSWYFNIRAVDRAGKWSDDFASYGPIIINDPSPANLVHQLQPGWNAVVVPRADDSASPGNVAAPGVLFGGDDTWWNVAPRNDGSQSTGMTLGAQLYVDGNALIDFFNPAQPGWATFPALTGFSHADVLNAGPVVIRPGRHMLGVLLDGSEQLIEADETDNGWAQSWAWMPPTVTPNQALAATSIPDYNGGWEWWGGGVLWPNSFGTRFLTDGRWNAFYAFADHEESDFDLHLYDASSDPQDALFNAVEQSNRGIKFLDAVFVNRDLTGGHQAWDVGIINGDFEPDSGSAGYGHVNSTNISFGVPHSDQLDAGEPMHLLDFDLPAGSTGPVSIVVDIDPADGQLTVLRLDSDYDMGPISVHNGIGVTDQNGNARLLFTLPDPGNMCVVLYRNKWNNDYFQSVPYTVTVETTPPDLLPQELAGWHAPIVPRSVNDGTPTTVLAPTQLTGWQNSTWINVTQENIGPTDAPGPFDATIKVDGAELWAQSVTGGISAGAGHVFNNLGVFLVHGGRHTVSLHADGQNEIYELSELNNDYGEQWVWSPFPLAFAPIIGASQPEPPTAGWETVDPLVSGPLWYNCDGFRTPSIDPALSDEYWMAMAVAPAAGSDVDLRIHDPVDDVKTGFRDPLAISGWGVGETDFVLVNYWLANPGSYDVGIVGSIGTGGYQLDVALAQQHGVPTGGNYGPFSLGDGELVALHEFILEPGFYWMELQDLSANADLGFSIHGWQQLHQGKSDHLEDGIAYVGGLGSYEQMTFIVDELQTGPYCVAVWKRGGTDASAVVDYALKFITITDAPSATPLAKAGITQVSPNPFNPRTEVMLHLDRQGDATVTIYNVRGELVRTLHRGELPAGENKLRWEGRDDQGRQVASGLYIVQLTADGVRDRRKITLLK